MAKDDSGRIDMGFTMRTRPDLPIDTAAGWLADQRRNVREARNEAAYFRMKADSLEKWADDAETLMGVRP